MKLSSTGLKIGKDGALGDRLLNAVKEMTHRRRIYSRGLTLLWLY
jgi:hypothetical protein